MSLPDASLALTFDDGPDPVWTPRILEQLRSSGVHGTFFVLGARVREAPTLLGDIVAAGHAVGLHGDHHLDHRRSSAGQLATDTRTALETLFALGVQPTLWRLPWGRHGEATAGLARDHGLDIVGWDIDTHDWRGDGWDDQPAARRAAVRAGGIVLLHDAVGPGALRTDCANTVGLVAAILRETEQADVPVRALAGGGPVHV